ncbi:MAG: hypothetical protein ABI813_08470 [Bacteroidota bacterium]
MQNRSMLSSTIMPVLCYFNVEAAIDWLSNHFGFTERWRVGNHHTQTEF